MELREAISCRVKEYLDERGWNVSELAIESGLSTSTLYNVMKGDCKSCNFITIINICRGLEVEVFDFLSSDIFLLENLADND